MESGSREFLWAKLYCSLLKQAQQTAQAVQQAIGTPVLICCTLAEIDFGERDGMAHMEIEQKYGEAFRNFYYHPSEYELPGEKICKTSGIELPRPELNSAGQLCRFLRLWIEYKNGEFPLKLINAV